MVDETIDMRILPRFAAPKPECDRDRAEAFDMMGLKYWPGQLVNYLPANGTIHYALVLRIYDEKSRGSGKSIGLMLRYVDATSTERQGDFGKIIYTYINNVAPVSAETEPFYYAALRNYLETRHAVKN